jgi:PEGA domain
MIRTAALAGLLLLTGCAEGIRLQSYPPGASVVLNGKFVGETPTVAWIPRSEWTGNAVPYRVQKEGYEPAEGAFDLCVSGGRVTGGVFTVGIALLFKPPRTFCVDPEIVRLTPKPFESDTRAR